MVEWTLPQERVHKWLAWAGGKDDLLRIGERVTALGDQHLKIDLNELAEDKYWQEKARAKWRTNLAAPHTPNKSMRGPPAKVIEKLDPRTVQQVEFDTGTEEYRSKSALSIRMSPKDGVTLKIESANIGWLSEAEATLSHEIGRCVPWWRCMRNYWAKAAYVIVAGFIGAVIGGVAGGVAGTFTGEFVGWGVGYLSLRVLLRSIPGFEVIPLGGAAKGRRTLGVVGAVALNMAAAAAGIIYSVVHSSAKK